MSTWALVGSPNSGKTTLYNWLTGAGSKVVNYPGSTVEMSMGSLRNQLSERNANADLNFVDTPGIYSLIPKSEDEQVTHDVLFATHKRVEKIHGVLMVIDATQLTRHLIIAKQVADSGYPAIFVLTMKDLLEKENQKIDLELLKKELGSSVVQFDGVMGAGLDDLIKEIVNFKNVENFNANNVKKPDWKLEKQTEVIRWAEALEKVCFTNPETKKSIRRFTDKVDTVLMHPIFGFVIFFAIMTALFASIYWLAAPAMDLIDSQFSALADLAKENIAGLAGEFIGSGLIAGIGGVVIFIPQIFILFVGLGLLESTGYLARVGVLIDKPLSMVGLGGRSNGALVS
jgi:ferrous iron transport protein B